MAIPVPSKGRAARLGVGGRCTPHEELAAVIAALVLLLNVTGALAFVSFVRHIAALQAASAVTLPVRKSAPKPIPSSTLVLAVHGDGSVWIDDAPVPLDSLAAMVRARAPQRVLMRAAQEARYPQMKAVLQELGRAGMTNVTFSVITTREPASIH